MSVKKPFENLLPQAEGSSPVSLNLTRGELQKPEGTQAFEMDAWPIMLFLRGVGFEKIIFQPGAKDVIELWAQRIQSYESEFIQDPENFSREEYAWNEKNLESEALLIECIHAELRTERSKPNIIRSVPPMDAPLGISDEAAKSFLDEVRRQSPQETFQRILSILVEYERDARQKDESLWAKLLGDTLAVALNSQLLDKAHRITSEHQQTLSHLWSDSERILRILGAYDPKPAELNDWAQLFDGCKTEILTGFLESHLSSPAGPQILKLMNYRAQRDPDQLIHLLRAQSPVVQKLLMQWLAPQWRAKHILFLEGTLSLIASSCTDEELLKIWITAFIRSSPKEAYERLRNYFKNPKWFWKKKELNPHFQHSLLSALSEYPSIDALEFLKEIRKTISKDLTHLVDRLIDTYRKGRG